MYVYIVSTHEGLLSESTVGAAVHRRADGQAMTWCHIPIDIWCQVCAPVTEWILSEAGDTLWNQKIEPKPWKSLTHFTRDFNVRQGNITDVTVSCPKKDGIWKRDGLRYRENLRFVLTCIGWNLITIWWAQIPNVTVIQNYKKTRKE